MAPNARGSTIFQLPVSGAFGCFWFDLKEQDLTRLIQVTMGQNCVMMVVCGILWVSAIVMQVKSNRYPAQPILALTRAFWMRLNWRRSSQEQNQMF